MCAGSTVVVVCGLPGVGKTTVSQYLADQLDAVRLRTDTVRKDIIDNPTYSDEETRRTYSALFKRTKASLADDRDVVLDGTFKRQWQRQQLQDEIAGDNVTIFILKVECADEVVRARIRSRTNDASDADYQIYEQHKTEYEPLTMDYYTIDNSHSLQETHDQVDQFIKTQGGYLGA